MAIYRSSQVWSMSMYSCSCDYDKVCPWCAHRGKDEAEQQEFLKWIDIPNPCVWTTVTAVCPGYYIVETTSDIYELHTDPPYWKPEPPKKLDVPPVDLTEYTRGGQFFAYDNNDKHAVRYNGGSIANTTLSVSGTYSTTDLPISKKQYERMANWIRGVNGIS